MKRIISALLSLMLLLSAMSTVIFADEEAGEAEGGEVAEEITNIALVENALPYASSEKNTLWTPAAALNDGKCSKDTWQGWECGYPNIIYGSDTSAGFSGEYCGIKFLNKEYYEISEIYVNLGMHAAMGGQNPHYLVQCLVEGVWVTVAEFSDSDTTPIVTDDDGNPKFSSYEEVMEKDTSFYHVGAEITLKLEQPVTTNNVRITLSNYAKNYPGGDVLIFPYIYEIVLMGKRGETPELELPEGAVVSTNIGYHSYPEASSSASFRYPYCAIDGDDTSYWSPKTRAEGEYLSLVLTEAKKINRAVVNFGKFQGAGVSASYSFKIEALLEDGWQEVASGVSITDEMLETLKVEDSIIFECEFDEVETTALRIVFTEAFKKAPTVYELEAHMSTDKTYYVEDRYDVYQIVSASKGNVAMLGTPYANRDFIPYSDVNYIIDGQAEIGSYVWFTGVIDMPAYCGIKFEQKQLIDSVALYFYVPAEEGIDIMSIQIQALIDGEYKTLVTTKSYDKDLKYSPAFKFDPVETDDIRILYTAGNGTFANMKEIEIYSPNGVAPLFEGLGALAEKPTFIDYSTKEAVKDDSIGQMSTQIDSQVENQSTNGTAVNALSVEPSNALLIVAISVASALGVMTVVLVCIAYSKKRKFR